MFLDNFCWSPFNFVSFPLPFTHYDSLQARTKIATDKKIIVRQGCTPRPTPPQPRGEMAALGRPGPKKFQECPAPPRKCPEFNCYPASPRAFSPCPAPKIYPLPRSAPPRRKKRLPLHPCSAGDPYFIMFYFFSSNFLFFCHIKKEQKQK